MSENLKGALQNNGENICFNAKMYFKSHTVTIFVQIILMLIPIILGIVSLSYGGIHILDVLSVIISVFSPIYYIYYGQNLEGYKMWGEKYMALYREIENYYKISDQYTKEDVDNVVNKVNALNNEKKPEYHLWLKSYVNYTIKKETTYSNETSPWWSN